MNIDFSSFTYFLQDINKILIGKKTEVKNEILHGCDAHTDLKTIKIDMGAVVNKCRNESEATLMLKAIDYHELAHIKFTDYSENELKEACNKIITEGGYDVDFMRLLNIMEDGRIERLFAALYPKAKDYFIAKNIWRVRNKEYDYLRLLGRKGLIPKKLLKQAEKKSDIPRAKRKKLAELFDKYAKESDRTRRLEIAKEAYFLIRKDYDWVKAIEEIDRVVFERKKATKKKEREIKLAIQKLSEAESEEEEEEEEEGEEEGEEEEGEGEGEEEGEEEEGEGEREGEGEESEEEEEGEEEEGEGEEKGSEGSEEEGERGGEQSEEEEELNKLIDTFIERTGEKGGRRKNGKEENYNLKYRPPLSLTKSEEEAIRSIASAIKKIRAELRSGWERGERSGRIDLRKAMKFKRNGDIKIFKKFKHDKERTSKMHYVILIDTSGSMATGYSIPRINVASKTLSILVEAIERGGGECAVISYDDDFSILKKFEEEWRRVYLHTGGQTYIEGALREAMNMLKDKNYACIIIITDGEFWDAKEAEEIIREANRRGVETVMIGIGRGKRHECKHFFTVEDNSSFAFEFMRLMKKVVLKMAKELTRKAM